MAGGLVQDLTDDIFLDFSELRLSQLVFYFCTFPRIKLFKEMVSFFLFFVFLYFSEKATAQFNMSDSNFTENSSASRITKDIKNHVDDLFTKNRLTDFDEIQSDVSASTVIHRTCGALRKVYNPPRLGITVEIQVVTVILAQVIEVIG